MSTSVSAAFTQRTVWPSHSLEISMALDQLHVERYVCGPARAPYVVWTPLNCGIELHKHWHIRPRSNTTIHSFSVYIMLLIINNNNIRRWSYRVKWRSHNTVWVERQEAQLTAMLGVDGRQSEGLILPTAHTAVSAPRTQQQQRGFDIAYSTHSSQCSQDTALSSNKTSKLLSSSQLQLDFNSTVVRLWFTSDLTTTYPGLLGLGLGLEAKFSGLGLETSGLGLVFKFNQTKCRIRLELSAVQLRF